jgi:hypothetical protein
MSVEVNQPFADFLFGCFAEYRASLPAGTAIQGKLWRDKVAEWHERWHEARKPRKQTKVVNSEADAIYALYPKKVGRKSALVAISRVLEKMPAEILAERVRSFASVVARWPAIDKPHLIPNPLTFFHQGRYDDDPAAWARPGMTAPVREKTPLPPIPEPQGWREYVIREWSPNSSMYDDAKDRTPWVKLTRGTQENLSAHLYQP